MAHLVRRTRLLGQITGQGFSPSPSNQSADVCKACRSS
jgi:hypothetical protein